MARSALDQLLVLRAQDGDTEALTTLIDRWHPRLLRHARRLTQRADEARDVAQEAWLAIVRDLGSLDDPGHFPAWSLRITTFKAADFARRARRRSEAERQATQPPEDASPGSTGSDDDERLRAAVRSLPEERRIPVELHYLEGLSVAEIARVLDIPEGTVKSRLHHARRELRAAVGGDKPGDD